MQKHLKRLATLMAMAGLALHATDHTLVIPASPTNSVDWGTATNWTPNGVPGSNADDKAILAHRTTGVDAKLTVDGGGASRTLDIIRGLNSASSNRSYEIANGIFTLNAIEKGGNANLDFAADTRLQAAGSTLELKLTGTNPNNLRLFGLIGDGAGGGNFAVDLSTETAGRNIRLDGANTYTGNTTVGAGVNAQLGIDSVVGGGVITSGPVGRATLILADGAILATPSGSRTLHNNVRLDGTATLANSYTFTASGLTTPSTILLTGDRTLVVNAASSIDNVITDGGNGYSFTKEGSSTLTLNAVNVIGGRLQSFGGTLALGVSDAYSSSGGLIAGNNDRVSAGAVNINASQNYTGGTLVEGARSSTRSTGQLAVATAGTLGANVAGNDVTVLGGVLKLAAPGNLGGNQALTVDSTGQSLGVLALSNSFSGVPTLASGSPFVLALDGGTYNLGVTSQATIGNGQIFIGNASSSAATFNAASLAPGTGNVYRLGGGGGSGILTVNPVLTEGGGTRLQVGATAANGTGTVQSNQTNTYAGETLINRSTFNLRGTTGTATASAGWTVNSGTLSLGENSNHVLDDGVTTFGRIGNDAPITLNSATLFLRGRDSNASIERFGELRLASGNNTLTTTTGGTGGSATLQAASFARKDTYGRSLVYLSANATNTFFKVDDAASVTDLMVGGDGSRATNQAIVPFARGSDGRNVWMTFNAANGFVPLSTTTDFVASVAAANADGNDNLRYAFTATQSETLATSKTVNSIIADDTAGTAYTQTIAGDADTVLTVKSGAIMLTGHNNAGLRITVPTLAFGAAEGILITTGTGGTGMPIASAITGSNGLTVNGGGSGVNLSGNNNGLSGPINVVSGTLAISSTRLALPTTADIYLGGGQIRSNVAVASGLAPAAAAVYGDGILGLDSVGAALNIGANTGGANGYVTLNDGGILAPGRLLATFDTDLATGTITIRNNQGNFATQTAGLALLGGQLHMDIANPIAHDEITFSTTNAAAHGLLLFGNPGSTLLLNLGYLPAAGEAFKLIDVTGSVPSTGRLHNPDNGNTVYGAHGGWLYPFDILYNSSLANGDGNDLVVRRTGAAAEAYTWAVDAAGAWAATDAALPNWRQFAQPDGVGAQVLFGDAITAPATVTLDGSKTAGTLTFDNANPYTLAAGGADTLRLDGGSGNAQLSVLAGSHDIAAPLDLLADLDIAVATGGDRLTLFGAVTGAHELDKLGGGVLELTGTNSYSGLTTVAAGTLLVNNASGSGTGTGAVEVAAGATLGGSGTLAPNGNHGIAIAGTLAPGNSIGTLSFDLGGTTGGLIFEPGATLVYELGTPSLGDQVRLLNYTPGDLTFNGNLVDILDLGGLGDGTYVLFAFFADDGLTPTSHGLTDGLLLGTLPEGVFNAYLDFVSDPTAILLQVLPIPEPGSALLLALAALGARRRRRPVW